MQKIKDPGGEIKSVDARARGHAQVRYGWMNRGVRVGGWMGGWRCVFGWMNGCMDG